MGEHRPLAVVAADDVRAGAARGGPGGSLRGAEALVRGQELEQVPEPGRRV